MPQTVPFAMVGDPMMAQRVSSTLITGASSARYPSALYVGSR
jgi:hypothetical protein